MEAKQMMDIRSSKERISGAESNEQQRKWSKDFLQKKADHPLKNYDPTRTHLNFEVTRGGKIQAIDTSMSIDEKMNKILQERGIKNPNERENAKRKNRIIAQIILGGNRQRMRELAFGAQLVVYSKGANNSHITRSKDIEKWAVDVYKSVAKHFGEENIISFYVHLDELNPHIHCTLLPIDEKTNRISWKSKFGNTKDEGLKILQDLHSSFYEEVGMKWGLDRGSDVSETGAKHRSTSEYERDLINHVKELEDTKEGLQKQIAKEERKLKSFTTMIANLQERKTAIQEEIDQIAKQFGEDGIDSEKLENRLKKLNKEMESVRQKLADRQKMLDNTNALLIEAREKLAELKNVEATTTERVNQLKREHAQMANLVKNDYIDKAEREFANIRGTYYKMLDDSFASVIDHLDHDQKETLHEAGYFDLKEEGEKVINCATLLAINFIKEAVTYSESHGGGGSSSLSGWGRKKDDDDERWWQRCIRQAAAMMKPGRKRGRGR